MIVGVVVVSGTVIADVILSYTANNSAGGNVAGPFAFNNGGNYIAAGVVGFSNAYPAGGPAGPTVTSTISGVATVPEEIINGTNFVTSTAIPAPHTGVILSPPITFGAPGAVAGIVCAYAFLSAGPQTFASAGAVPGEPAGCGAYLPTTTAPSTFICGGGAVAGMEAIDLVTGAVTVVTPWVCTVQSGLPAGDIVLYISYAITTSSGFAGNFLASFSIQVHIS